MTPAQDVASRRQGAAVGVSGAIRAQQPENNVWLGVVGLAPPEWTADALCAETDPELFFPEKGVPAREAKRICGRCTVSAECLTYALDNAERFGIWGGFSERERRRLLAA